MEAVHMLNLERWIKYQPAYCYCHVHLSSLPLMLCRSCVLAFLVRRNILFVLTGECPGSIPIALLVMPYGLPGIWYRICRLNDSCI